MVLSLNLFRAITMMILLSLVQGNYYADSVDPLRIFHFVDDLSVLYLFMLGVLLTECYFKQHVAINKAINEKYLPANNLKKQNILNSIAELYN